MRHGAVRPQEAGGYWTQGVTIVKKGVDDECYTID